MSRMIVTVCLPSASGFVAVAVALTLDAAVVGCAWACAATRRLASAMTGSRRTGDKRCIGGFLHKRAILSPIFGARTNLHNPTPTSAERSSPFHAEDTD